jgi:hypothetical protein
MAVPHSLTGFCRLSVVGATTSEEVAKQRTKYLWKVSLCRDFLNWLSTHNKMYMKYHYKINVSEYKMVL